MQLSHRRIVVAAFSTLAFVVCAQTSRAQQPEPLRLSSPPAHALLHAEPLAQAQTQTAQGELLDVHRNAPCAERVERVSEFRRERRVVRGRPMTSTTSSARSGSQWQQERCC